MLARPQKFMNLSGQPVASLMGYHKLKPEQVVVVHDDMGLPFGTVRLRGGGGHGGHNGLRDLISHIGQHFPRIRVGIGRPQTGWDPADFVLGKWTGEEVARLPNVIDTGSDAAEAILSGGLIAAMNKFNVRDKHGPLSNPSAPSTGAVE